MERIYLDHNSGTFLDERVRSEYEKSLGEYWANPSSVHHEGQKARSMLAHARSRIAECFFVHHSQIVFFSTATEGLNTLIRGLLGDRILTSHVEHPAVWRACQRAHPLYLAVDKRGYPAVSDVEAALQQGATGMALMSVNNETGVIAPYEEYAELAVKYHVPFVVDGVAHLGKIPFIFAEGITAACFSSYKIHGPSGVAFAVINKKTRFNPLIIGGGQEFGLRSGTENVPAIIACARSVELILSEMQPSKIGALRDHFESRLMYELQGIERNGTGGRAPNTSNLAFANVRGEDLLIQLDRHGLAASHGSACSAGAMEPSRILLAMGYSHERVASSLRFSLSKFTTKEEIDQAVDMIKKCLVSF